MNDYPILAESLKAIEDMLNPRATFSASVMWAWEDLEDVSGDELDEAIDSTVSSLKEQMRREHGPVRDPRWSIHLHHATGLGDTITITVTAEIDG